MQETPGITTLLSKVEKEKNVEPIFIRVMEMLIWRLAFGVYSTGD